MIRSEFVQRIKDNEGNKAYQTKKGYFKDGLFHRYKDSLGFWTIGYGHLITPNENLMAITEEHADGLLLVDITKAQRDVAGLSKNDHPVVQEVLVEMVFQLGKGGVQKFKKLLAALDRKDYKVAILEMKDSQWYRQTPQRVETHAKRLGEL